MNNSYVVLTWVYMNVSNHLSYGSVELAEEVAEMMELSFYSIEIKP